MTATFGSLEHRTLEFTPGLNILSGENEWGKSTWCAFLLAMLYGLDTRAKTTRQALSPKERYTPWSGSPMSGTVALNWNGRRVTLERTTKGRVPMGAFRAYETETGLPVPELTADNCGQTLLGVEREVFCRAGFIRQEEMPVTQSEALRARLNALVTTGDEGVDEAALARKLKELKNKCRFNQSGLLPQAEKQLRELEEALRERERLEGEISRLEGQLALTEAYLQSLKTHQAALDYAKASMDARQVQKARAEAEKAAREADKMEEICADLPTRAEAEERLRDLAAHMNAWNEAGAERSRCAQMPELPQAPEVFRGLSGEQALQKAREDGKAYRSIVGRGFWTFLILAALSILGGLVLLLGFGELIPALVYVGVGTLLLAVSLLVGSREKEKQKTLAIPYGGGTPDAWEAKARTYADALQRYYNEKQDWTHRQTEQEQQLQGLLDEGEGAHDQPRRHKGADNRPYRERARTPAVHARLGVMPVRTTAQRISPSGSILSCILRSVRRRRRLTCTWETPRRLAISTCVRPSMKRMRTISCSRGEKSLMASSMTMRSSEASRSSSTEPRRSMRAGASSSSEEPPASSETDV